jgi:hypothetical protein
MIENIGGLQWDEIANVLDSKNKSQSREKSLSPESHCHIPKSATFLVVARNNEVLTDETHLVAKSS